jgi:hypothetical protein
MSLTSKVQNSWRTAAREFGFQFVCPFAIESGSKVVEYHGMVVGFGSPKGTVFLASSGCKGGLGTAHRAAVKNGYHFSQLNADVYCEYDRRRFSDTLKDWGWHSKEAIPPLGFKLPIRKEKKGKPNQLSDPTSPPVTPPAGAGVAPSVAADH